MVPGVGTALNVGTVLAGSAIGVVLRGRLPERTRGVVTDGLGLGTLMIAGINASALRPVAGPPGRPGCHRPGRAGRGSDGFASIAFAASFGWGVAASALTVAVVQGGLTLLGVLLGGLLPAGLVAAVTAADRLLLADVALRLPDVKPVPVGDLLPALLAAPALAAMVAALR